MSAKKYQVTITVTKKIKFSIEAASAKEAEVIAKKKVQENPLKVGVKDLYVLVSQKV